MNNEISKEMAKLLSNHPDALFACVLTVEGTHCAGKEWFEPYQELQDLIAEWTKNN